MAYNEEEVIPSDDIAESGEIKNPVQYYNLKNKDFQEGNGSATGGDGFDKVSL